MYDLSLNIILVGWISYVLFCFVKGEIVFHVVMNNQVKSRGIYRLITRIKGKNYIIKTFINLVRSIDIILKLLFPNWIISDYFKRRIGNSFQGIEDKKKKRDTLKEFIQTMNYLNLLISLICAVYLFGLTFRKGEIGDICFRLFYFMLCLRTFSRSYEIIKAFLNDVLQSSNCKSSSLKYYERLKLALISFIEVTINYSLIYYIYTRDLTTALGESIGNSLLVDVEEINFVTVFQILTSMTLIYLALADYIGSKGDKEGNIMKKTIVRRRGEEVVEVEEIVETEEFQENKEDTKEVECCDTGYLLGLMIGGFLILVCICGIYFYHDYPICIRCPDEKTSHEEINIDINMTINEDYITQTEVKEQIELGE